MSFTRRKKMIKRLLQNVNAEDRQTLAGLRTKVEAANLLKRAGQIDEEEYQNILRQCAMVLSDLEAKYDAED